MGQKQVHSLHSRSTSGWCDSAAAQPAMANAFLQLLSSPPSPPRHPTWQASQQLPSVATRFAAVQPWSQKQQYNDCNLAFHPPCLTWQASQQQPLNMALQPAQAMNSSLQSTLAQFMWGSSAAAWPHSWQGTAAGSAAASVCMEEVEERVARCVVSKMTLPWSASQQEECLSCGCDFQCVPTAWGHWKGHSSMKHIPSDMTLGVV
jgi:hypothetical protein